MGHSRFFFRDFERLDRQVNATRRLVDAHHHGIDLVTHGKPLGPLIGPGSRQIATANKAFGSGIADADFNAIIVNRGDRAGHYSALFLSRRGAERIALQLLDAEADAFLFLVNIEYGSLDGLALLIIRQRRFARALPVQIRQMDHAVNIVFEADKKAKFGDVLDLALDRRADRIFGFERLPGVFFALFQAEADAALFAVDLKNHDVNHLRGRNDLARVDILLGPGHFRDVHQAFDSRLKLNKGSIVGNVGDRPFELLADRVPLVNAIPWIRFQLLDPEAYPLTFRVYADDLDLERISNI